MAAQSKPGGCPEPGRVLALRVAPRQALPSYSEPFKGPVSHVGVNDLLPDPYPTTPTEMNPLAPTGFAMSNSSLIPLSAPSTNLFVGLSARERTADAVAPERVNLRDISIPRTHVPAQSPRAFVAGLAAQSLQHRAVVHPYLNAVGLGELPDIRWALADFGQQYHGYSKDFPCYLTAVISRLSDPRHRAGLMENLTEESGIYETEELSELGEVGIEPEWIVGQPHPLLFNRFCKAMGLKDHDLDSEPDQIVIWREMFMNLLSSGTPAEAVGALGLGTENIVSTIYKPFSRAVAMIPELSARDTVFFPLHTAVDDHHQETLQAISADLAVDEATRRQLRRGMLKALSLRSAFWDWMYRRALDPQNADQAL